MILIPFATAAGILVALLRNGGFEGLRSVRIRWMPLLVAGAVLSVLADLTPIPGAIGFLIVGMLMLLAGLAVNVHLTGAISLGIGILLNTLVMVANAHIPVRLESLVGSGEVGAGELSPDLGAVRQLEDADTRLAFLGDIVPIGLLNTVVSFGDLIASAGVIVLTFRLLTRKTGMVDINDLFDEVEIDLREPQVRRTQQRRTDRSVTSQRVRAPQSPQPQTPQRKSPPTLGGPPPLEGSAKVSPPRTRDHDGYESHHDSARTSRTAPRSVNRTRPRR